MLQDPMSLLSAYMQGSRFAQENIDRARAREEEDNKRMVDAGMGVLLSHTTRVNPQTGQVELRPEAEIWKDPQFLRDFSDTAFGQQVLREGMTDEQKKSVAKIVPVRATQISAGKTGAPEYGIEVEWQDENGKPLSRGPIAVDANGQRSASNDAMVVPIKTSDVFHTALSKAYQYTPELAKQYKAHLLDASQRALTTQWMQDPASRPAIEQQFALAGGDPTYFEKLTKYDLEKRPYTTTSPTGLKTTTNPDRSTSISYDPEAAKVGDELSARETQRAVERQTGLTTGRLTDEENLFLRSSDLEKKQILAKAQSDVNALRQTLSDRTQIRSAEDTARLNNELEFKEKNLDRLNRISESQIASTGRATSRSAYENAPTEVATANIKAKGLDDFRKGLNAADGALYDQGMGLLSSANPDDRQKGHQIMQTLIGDPAKTEEFVRQKGAERTLHSALDSNFNGMTPEQVTQTVGANYDFMSKPEQESFQKSLMNGLRNGDPNAKAAYDATMFPPTGGSAGKTETIKPADFKAESVRRYISSDVSDDVRNKADLNGEVIFTQTLEQLNAMGIAVPKDSIGAARLNRATAHALVLGEQEGLSNTGPTLYARETLMNKWGEAATGSPDEFSKNLVLPLGKRMQELKTPTDFRTVFEATENAVALKALGVSHNEAVDWGAKLADPVVARQISEEAQRAGAKNADDVRRYVAEKIKNRPKPTVAERNQSLSAALDPAPFLEQAPQRIWGGIRDAFQPGAPGPAPTYYRGR